MHVAAELKVVLFHVDAALGPVRLIVSKEVEDMMMMMRRQSQILGEGGGEKNSERC